MTHTRPFPLPRPWFIRRQSTLRHLVAVGVLLSLFLPWSVILQTPRAGAQSSQGPSAFCHTTDGTFTDCDPQTAGREEWSDVQPSAFAAANSFLYVNQNATKSALFLMYDFPFRTAPLASSQAVRISFDTVEQEPEGAALERYDVDIFGNGHMTVSVFGEPEPPNGIIGAVGFGPSPNSNVPHLMAELQVPLIPGGATVYSPDPLFWSASVPPPPPPPKQGRFTQEQKESFAKTAADLNIGAAVGATVAAACLLAPDPSVSKACAIAAGLTSGIAWILSGIYGRLALDPSDPNFTEIAVPVTPTLSQQPITAGDGVTQQEADALNALFTNLEQTIGLGRALQTSIDRAQGAREAGDAFWEGQQLAAAKNFAGQIANLSDQQADLFANVATALGAAGFQQSFTDESIAQFQSSVDQQGFPSFLTQAFAELGADSALQDEIRLAFLNKSSAELSSVGGGQFPASLTDPTLTDALHQLATSLTLFSQPPVSSLNPSLNVLIAGDYTAAGVGLRDRTEGTISLAGVPAEAHVVQAVLYWGMLDNGESQSLKNLNFNGTPLIGTRIAIGPDTCWGRTASFAFRADVTPLVSGNGSYNLTGVASGGGILAEGASLVVFYEQLGAPLKNVILLDGNVVLPFQTINATSAFSGFLPANPASAKTTFVVGDGQPFDETARFIGSAGTNTFLNPFGGGDGPLWDTDTFDVSAQVGPSSGSSSAEISIGSDCLMWVAQVFSITTNPSENVPDVRATAAVVEANEDGTTTVGPTGLFPINEPSLAERVFLIVKDRVEENPGTLAAELTEQLVDSLVEGGLLPPEDAEKLIEEVLQRLFVPVDIDIKPGGFPNSINLGSNGSIPVAILSTATFNAPSLVNRATLTFGRTGDEHSLLRSSIEDVNKDGRPDVVCLFDTQLAAFQPGDTVGVLKGLTNTGQPIRGTDSIRIVPPK